MSAPVALTRSFSLPVPATEAASGGRGSGGREGGELDSGGFDRVLSDLDPREGANPDRAVADTPTRPADEASGFAKRSLADLLSDASRPARTSVGDGVRPPAGPRNGGPEVGTAVINSGSDAAPDDRPEATPHEVRDFVAHSDRSSATAADDGASPPPSPALDADGRTDTPARAGPVALVVTDVESSMHVEGTDTAVDGDVTGSAVKSPGADSGIKANERTARPASPVARTGVAIPSRPVGSGVPASPHPDEKLGVSALERPTESADTVVVRSSTGGSVRMSTRTLSIEGTKSALVVSSAGRVASANASGRAPATPSPLMAGNAAGAPEVEAEQVSDEERGDRLQVSRAALPSTSPSRSEPVRDARTSVERGRFVVEQRSEAVPRADDSAGASHVAVAPRAIADGSSAAMSAGASVSGEHRGPVSGRSGAAPGAPSLGVARTPSDALVPGAIADASSADPSPALGERRDPGSARRGDESRAANLGLARTPPDALEPVAIADTSSADASPALGERRHPGPARRGDEPRAPSLVPASRPPDTLAPAAIAASSSADPSPALGERRDPVSSRYGDEPRAPGLGAASRPSDARVPAAVADSSSADPSPALGERRDPVSSRYGDELRAPGLGASHALSDAQVPTAAAGLPRTASRPGPSVRGQQHDTVSSRHSDDAAAPDLGTAQGPLAGFTLPAFTGVPLADSQPGQPARGGQSNPVSARRRDDAAAPDLGTAQAPLVVVALPGFAGPPSAGPQPDRSARSELGDPISPQRRDDVEAPDLETAQPPLVTVTLPSSASPPLVGPPPAQSADGAQQDDPRRRDAVDAWNAGIARAPTVEVVPGVRLQPSWPGHSAATTIAHDPALALATDGLVGALTQPSIRDAMGSAGSLDRAAATDGTNAGANVARIVVTHQETHLPIVAPPPALQLADAIGFELSQSGDPSTPPWGNAATTPLAGRTMVRVLSITLAPEHLGNLSVQMRLSGGRLELAIEASGHDAARAIEQDKATLSDAMRAMGISLDSVVVRAGAGDARPLDGGNNGSAPASGQSGAHQDGLSGGRGDKPGGNGAGTPHRDASPHRSNDAAPVDRTRVAGTARSDLFL